MRASLLGWLCLGALVGCAHATRPVEIAVHPVTGAGRDAVVRVAIPADWVALVGSDARQEFLAPDRRSRAYVRGMEGETDVRKCTRLARDYAKSYVEAWGGPPNTRVASKVVTGPQVDLELHRREPKPQGEIIWTRVICRLGALAIASCTIPTQREPEVHPLCTAMIESLSIEPSTPAASAQR